MSKDSNKAAKNLRASGAELLTLGITLPYQLASAGMPASGLGAGSLTAGAPLVIEARRGGGGPHVNRNIHVNRNLHVNRNIHVKGKNIQGGKKRPCERQKHPRQQERPCERQELVREALEPPASERSLA
jgi:hypothetical protein